MNSRIFFKDTSAMGSLLVLGPIPQASRTAARQVSIGGRRAHLIFDGTLGRFPAIQNLRGSWRRLFAVIRRSLRLWMRHISRAVQYRLKRPGSQFMRRLIIEK